MREFLLNTPDAVLDALEEQCEGRGGTTKVNKHVLKGVLMDYRKLVAEVSGPGLIIKSKES